mgnify:CR=1 FL=1
MLLFVACAVLAGLLTDARRQLRVARDGWALAEQRNEWYGALADRRGRMAAEWREEATQWRSLAESLCTPGEPAGMAAPHLDTAPSLRTEKP